MNWNKTTTPNRILTTAAAIWGMLAIAGLGITIDFEGGSSPSDGADGNIRTFSAGGISVNVSAWSVNLDDEWQTAYLGHYRSGLGVTNQGRNDGHTVDNRPDNTGWDEYVLFEFSTMTVPTMIELNYVGYDSDITVSYATAVNPFSNHLDLTQADDRALFEFMENDFVRHGYDRDAYINDNAIALNALLVSPVPYYHYDGNDSFKIGSLALHYGPNQVPDGGSTLALLGMTSIALAIARRRKSC